MVAVVSRQLYWCYCCENVQVVAWVVAWAVAWVGVAWAVAWVGVAWVAQVPCQVASREEGPVLVQVGAYHSCHHQNQALTCGCTSWDFCAKIEINAKKDIVYSGSALE